MNLEEAWANYQAQELADYKTGRSTTSSIPRRDTFEAGWRAANIRPTPEECDTSEAGHQFYDQCAVCGVDAHEWFNRPEAKA